jgi:hypothetical protein
VFEIFRAAVAEDSAWCNSREMCSRVGTETKSARAGSPAIKMTLGTCGSSGKARAASALAREDSQKSGVNGWETQTTSLFEQISLHESHDSVLTMCISGSGRGAERSGSLIFRYGDGWEDVAVLGV